LVPPPDDRVCGPNVPAPGVLLFFDLSLRFLVEQLSASFSFFTQTLLPFSSFCFRDLGAWIPLFSTLFFRSKRFTAPASETFFLGPQAFFYYPPIAKSCERWFVSFFLACLCPLGVSPLRGTDFPGLSLPQFPAHITCFNRLAVSPPPPCEC